MYSRDKRMKVIALYIKYGKSAARVIRELGYPCSRTLAAWYRIYLEEQKTGVLHDRYMRAPTYSPEKKQAAVDHFLAFGRSISKTVRAKGYPRRETLRSWCYRLLPNKRKERSGGIQYTCEQKREAVEALYSRECSAKEVADTHGVTRAALYLWKKLLLVREGKPVMPEQDNTLSKKQRRTFIGG